MKRFVSLLVIFCFCASLMGCATTKPRYISNAAQPDSLAEKFTAKDRNIEVRISYLIIPNARGSFVKDAPWDEWGVEVKNITEKDILIKGFYLIDPRGVLISRGKDIPELQQMTKTLSDEYEQAGIMVIAGGGAALGATLLSYAGAGAGLVLWPLTTAAVIAVPLFMMKGEKKKAKDAENIKNEFRKRNLPEFIVLSPKGAIEGSLFFPIVPSPKALVVVYRDPQGKEKTLKIKLEALKGLHQKTANSKK